MSDHKFIAEFECKDSGSRARGSKPLHARRLPEAKLELRQWISVNYPGGSVWSCRIIDSTSRKPRSHFVMTRDLQ